MFSLFIGPGSNKELERLLPDAERIDEVDPEEATSPSQGRVYPRIVTNVL